MAEVAAAEARGLARDGGRCESQAKDRGSESCCTGTTDEGPTAAHTQQTGAASHILWQQQTKAAAGQSHGGSRRGAQGQQVMTYGGDEGL